MKKSISVLLCTAISLVAAGFVTLFILNKNLTGFNTADCETVTYEIADSFTSILTDTHISDISFVPCDEGAEKVVWYKPKNADCSVYVDNNNLIITENYDNIRFFDFKNPEITVYMPQKEYNSLIVSSTTGDTHIPDDFNFENIEVGATTGSVECRACASNKIKIKLTTGNIILENASANETELSVTTGCIDIASVKCDGDLSVNVRTGTSKLSNITCKNVLSNGSTGGITLKNVIADEKFDIKRSTGNVKFEACDAENITVTTSTGSVTGTLLSKKTFIAKSNTGHIDVPQTTDGGECNITTKTGTIIISLP